MIRAVLDTNVLVAAVLSRDGAPASLLRAWRDGRVELVVSPQLLDELSRVLAYPKLRPHVSQEQAARFVALLAAGAETYEDPAAPPPVRSCDPDDDYLLALAVTASAHLVTGDGDLLDLPAELPVHTPAEFVGLLDDG